MNFLQLIKLLEYKITSNGKVYDPNQLTTRNISGFFLIFFLDLMCQVDSLQQKIIQLEHNQTLQIKKALSEPSQPLESSKTIQTGSLYSASQKGALFDRKSSETKCRT